MNFRSGTNYSSPTSMGGLKRYSHDGRGSRSSECVEFGLNQGTKRKGMILTLATVKSVCYARIKLIRHRHKLPPEDIAL